MPAPVSYSVADIGQKAVPRLSRRQLSEIAAIERRVHSRTLRFAYVVDESSSDGFIVFDATQGPCADFALGYPVLNASSKNDYYEPGENPYATHAGPPF